VPEAGVPDGAGWVEVVEVCWVPEVALPDVPSGCDVVPAALTPLVPVAEVCDELSPGATFPPATALGLAPPTLIAVEVPPVALRFRLAGAVLVVEVERIVWVSVELDGAWPSVVEAGATRGRGGVAIGGGETVGVSSAGMLARAGVRATRCRVGASATARV
jgi:hypothetical protein